jgi:hypothetical protein
VALSGLGDARAYAIPPAVEALSDLMHIGLQLMSGLARTMGGA